MINYPRKNPRIKRDFFLLMVPANIIPEIIQEPTKEHLDRNRGGWVLFWIILRFGEDFQKKLDHMLSRFEILTY